MPRLALRLRVLFAAWSTLGFAGCTRTTAAPPPSRPIAVDPPKGDPKPQVDPGPQADLEPKGDSELAAMTLPARPDWADKYAGSNPDERFLDIAALMNEHGLDRAHAVELQNHFRDLTRAEPTGDRDAQYAEALRRAKSGIFEDGRDPQRLAKARFIIVFDLDETLLDQRFDDKALGKACHDLAVPKGDGTIRHVKLTPGWADAIRRVHALGGEVVLFSANLDDRCYSIAREWVLDGVPILEHPAVAGFMTNSHLVLQPKRSGSSVMEPVVEPSKDLRIVDPDLRRAIIVDDNPRRLFQFRNVRLFKKFQADPYCAAKTPGVKRAHDAGLKVVVDEIEDSVRYMDAHPGTTFADAYLPYTVLGQATVRWLRAGATRNETKAIAHLRAHPELADDHF